MQSENGVNENAVVLVLARPSCTICQFWLLAGQWKSIADKWKLLYVFWSKKWWFAWLMSFI